MPFADVHVEPIFPAARRRMRNSIVTHPHIQLWELSLINKQRAQPKWPSQGFLPKTNQKKNVLANKSLHEELNRTNSFSAAGQWPSLDHFVPHTHDKYM